MNNQYSDLIINDTNIHPHLDKIAPARTQHADLYKRIGLRINVIRFVAICSVIWGHCLSGLDRSVFNGLIESDAQAALLQTGRIGTVLFFMISGYLISDKINDFNVISYLRYRFPSIILPWLIFVTLLVFLQLFQGVSFYQMLHGGTRQYGILIIKLYKAAVFHAAYWFIPVAILSSLILIACKRYVRHLWFGALLCCFTIFYSVNLFYNWIPSSHTEAFLGYVLFLWIGTQVKVHLCTVVEVLNGISWGILMPLLLVAFTLACKEGMILRLLHSDDPYASIRVSNITFSVILFFSLIKSDRFEWVERFNPRQNIYGIYLIHTIFIMLLTRLVTNQLNKHNHLGILGNFAGIILFFTVILTISYLTVCAIKRTPLYFMIGRNR